VGFTCIVNKWVHPCASNRTVEKQPVSWATMVLIASTPAPMNIGDALPPKNSNAVILGFSGVINI